MTGYHDPDDPSALHAYRRSVFGNHVGNETMPMAFVAVVRRTTAHADHMVGVRRDGNAREVFWLEGGILGVLSCMGNSDEDAVISGHIVQLDSFGVLAVEVAVEFNRWEQSSSFGRVLMITDDIKIDATPGSALPEVLEQREEFIDAVLAVVAGRKIAQ